MNTKQIWPLVIGIGILYVAFVGGGMLVDYLATILPEIFAPGLVGDTLQFAIPAGIGVILLWKFGKKG